ncbi:flavodoxin family protein [Nitratireductor pacificus]|uniref:NADPH-dependent FMN reductase-like domain-containing protein n=1 Tax=Nitratireductor pacificus pht-3B TaxID=391937 RepID=K2ME20_9HYPH|nr:NAD(P)H-dependent oxidoreductase [Nitratireductor pacificus]EKF20421.1 hypothetical protein NA2_04167 [Nitratireductor pacificus pht-3B]
MPLNDLQKRLVADNATDFTGLNALFVNTTLKPGNGAPSHTQDLVDDSIAIMKGCGIETLCLRAADFRIAFGVSPDMREEGAEIDDWPEKIWPKVREADILVIGSPIWLGEESSICRVIIERLYAHSGQRNEKGQYVYYGKVGGTIITGNEDGIKHVAKTVLYSLQHIGYAIPPQADCGWIGEAGPGPSYGDETEDGRRAGYDSVFTRRNLTFMTFNLMHMARMLRQSGGLPDYGNQTTEWD